MRKRHTSNLRAVREATGLTQQKFAAEIGTTKAIVENVETGRSPLPEELAWRVSALAGVDAKSLYTDAPPVSFNGEALTDASYKKWRQVDYSGEQADELIGASKDFIQVLLTAAYRTPSGKTNPHLFREILIELNQFIFGRAHSKGLSWIIEGLIRDELSQTATKKLSVGQLRRLFNGDSEWNKHDAPDWPDAMEAEVTETHFPLFVPFMGFGEHHGKPAFINCKRERRHIFTVNVGGSSFRITQDRGSARLLTADEPTPPSGQPSPTPPPPPVESPKTPKRRRA